MKQTKQVLARLYAKQPVLKHAVLLRELILSQNPSTDVIRVARLLAQAEQLFRPLLAQVKVSAQQSSHLPTLIQTTAPEVAQEINQIVKRADWVIRRANLTVNGKLRSASQEIYGHLYEICRES